MKNENHIFRQFDPTGDPHLPLDWLFRIEEDNVNDASVQASRPIRAGSSWKTWLQSPPIKNQLLPL